MKITTTTTTAATKAAPADRSYWHHTYKWTEIPHPYANIELNYLIIWIHTNNHPFFTLNRACHDDDGYIFVSGIEKFEGRKPHSVRQFKSESIAVSFYRLTNFDWMINNNISRTTFQCFAGILGRRANRKERDGVWIGSRPHWKRCIEKGRNESHFQCDWLKNKICWKRFSWQCWVNMRLQWSIFFSIFILRESRASERKRGKARNIDFLFNKLFVWLLFGFIEFEWIEFCQFCQTFKFVDGICLHTK